MEKIVISDDMNTAVYLGEKLVFKPLERSISCQGCRFFGDMNSNCFELMIPCCERPDGKMGIFTKAID